MERILTNYQVQWLSNLKLLSDYEDSTYEKDEVTEKVCNFINNDYLEQIHEIIKEFEVLNQKGFLNLQISKTQLGSVEIENINITKAGLDYLVMLEEDFKEKAVFNENISQINRALCSIDQNCEKLNEKSLLDKIEQYTTIGSNALSSVSSFGSLSQGIIPLICKILGIQLH